MPSDRMATLSQRYRELYPNAKRPKDGQPTAHYVQWKNNQYWLAQTEEKAGTFLPELIDIYNNLKKTKGQYAANLSLTDFREKAPRLKILRGKKYTFYRKELNLAGDNDDLNDFCATKSRHCQRLIDSLPDNQITIALYDLLETYGIELTKQEAKKIKTRPFQLRLTSERWWRRKIKPIAFRVCEQIWREMGHTRRGKGVYVSNYTLRRFLSREQRNRNLLENLEATNELYRPGVPGNKFTLAELSDLNTSNPELRRNELMVRMRGFEEFAEANDDWQGMFYTLTCPSKYHIYSENRLNEKYNGNTPRQAQRYLCNIWEKVRAQAGNKKIQVFGFRIAEPHHDGCPHWHLLLFIKADREREFSEDFRSHALRVDGKEPGAVKHRFTAKRIDKSKGTAAGYIAKYVSKNIDGFEVGDDWEANEAANITAIRVRAWAACWGIRQFQQIGGPSVQVYREFRRLANHPEQIPQETKAPDQLRLLLIACDDGDWCDYTTQMGGAVVPRKKRPAKLFYSEPIKKDHETGMREKKLLNQYGEEAQTITGILTDWFIFPLITRVHCWSIELTRTIAKRASKAKFAKKTGHLLPVDIGTTNNRWIPEVRIQISNDVIEKTPLESLQYKTKSKKDDFWSTYIPGKKRGRNNG